MYRKLFVIKNNNKVVPGHLPAKEHDGRPAHFVAVQHQLQEKMCFKGSSWLTNEK
jgi:hypothetical protein